MRNFCDGLNHIKIHCQADRSMEEENDINANEKMGT